VAARPKAFETLTIEILSADLKLIHTIARYFHVTRGDMLGALLSRGLVETIKEIDALRAKTAKKRRRPKN
jgi:hypothetical protein